MNGFLFDENLPANVQFTPSFPVKHVSLLGENPSDTAIWEYAKRNDLVIVTKDVDLSDRIMLSSSSPKVVHLRIGNMRKREFHTFLARVWPSIEELIVRYRLVNVYSDRFELVE